METSPPITTDISKEDVDRIICACAEACGVGREILEKICPASEEQEYRMNHHIKSGSSYMMQMVLQYEGDLNRKFLLRVLSAIRFKNHVLRTRLIKYEGRVYQVILRDSLVFQQVAVSLDVFMAHNSQVRMNYGTPLFRYAFTQELDGESFFVWSAHYSAVDAWTLRLIFDDLQTACSDLEAYCKVPPRPPYGRYARWLESRASEAGRAFWLTRHTAFDDLVHEFPVLGPGSTTSVSTTTMKTKKLLHLPKMENTEFGLPTMGHAAWALTILNLHNQAHLPLPSTDLSFLSLISARRSCVSGLRHMMGPISCRVPLRITLLPTTPLSTLMRDIETQFAAMIGLEHCAMKALAKDGRLQSIPKQAVFHWKPPGRDVSSSRVVCHDRQAAPAVLAYREDLSVAFAHDYGLLFEVYEHGGHIAINARWDHILVEADLVRRLLDYFVALLSLIIKMEGGTVSELLSEYGARRASEVAGSECQ